MGPGVQKEHYEILGSLLIVIIKTPSTNKKITWREPCIWKAARKTPRKVLRPDGWIQTSSLFRLVTPFISRTTCCKSFVINVCFTFVYFSSSSNSNMYYCFLHVQTTSFWAPRISKCLWSRTWQKLGYWKKTNLYWVTAAWMCTDLCD